MRSMTNVRDKAHSHPQPCYGVPMNSLSPERILELQEALDDQVRDIVVRNTAIGVRSCTYWQSPVWPITSS